MTALENLIERWAGIKVAEDNLREERQELARDIAAALEHPAEGSKTHNVGPYKVTVRGSVNRRVDWAAFEAVMAEHPEAHSPHKVKRELDAVGLRWIQENEPGLYLALSEAITSTPGAPGIKVEVIDA